MEREEAKCEFNSQIDGKQDLSKERLTGLKYLKEVKALYEGLESEGGQFYEEEDEGV